MLAKSLIMSRPTDQSQHLTSGASEDKKIFFKGLEKCLEAFTSGEGRVVRKYARLFSQLSGQCREDEEEDISWSSSDEDDKGASSHNTSVCRRSKVTRKLNSQINFDNRINARKNGRRLTSAEFSRTVEYMSQDLFAINSQVLPPDQTANPVSQDTDSVFNNGIIIDRSYNLVIESENSKVKDGRPLTPQPESGEVDSDITSPVFKLNASRKIYRIKRRCDPGKMENDKSCGGAQEEVDGNPRSPEPLPAVNNDTSNGPLEPFLPLTPENKTTNGLVDITSPVLGRSASRYHNNVTSPGAPSSSPVMRRTARRKRTHNTSLPVSLSPILQPQKKTTSANRKKQKLATFKSSSQGQNITLNSTGLSERLLSLTQSLSPDTSMGTVKRSLKFALDKDHDITETIAGSETDSKSEISTDQPIPRILPEDNVSNNILNSTNAIEEVRTEELDLSVIPKTVGRKKKRLSLRNTRKRASASASSSPEIIENSQTQCLIGTKAVDCTFKAPVSRAIQKVATGKSRPSEEEPRITLNNNNQKLELLNLTSKIEEVYTEDLILDPFRGICREKDGSDSAIYEDILCPRREEYVLDGACAGDTSQPQFIPCSQISPEERKIETRFTRSSRTLAETSEEMSKEFRGLRRSKDQELIISQSSTKSGDHFKSTEAGSPEIESVSSQASRGNKNISGPSTGTISKSNSTRSPAVSSPLVISSAGSSPDTRQADQPFLITEDEYNAPPKKRSKKLDPNGIANRLQRLLNQRRSAARIWQYNRSKLGRLNNVEGEKAVEESQGRELTVFSVQTDYSHIVLFSREDKGDSSKGKVFRDDVLVVLDPGVVLRLGKVMNASKIKIFPPWQSMDLAGRDKTVILGANIVEVISTQRDTNSLSNEPEESAVVKRYACHCSPIPPPDSTVLECWDGVQSLGLVDILFPLDAPPCTQLIQFEDNTSKTLQGSDQSIVRRDKTKYTIKALLSTQSTTSHGKSLLVLTVLRVFCYWQRGFGLTSQRSTLPHWSVFGRDDSDEVCELILGPEQNSEVENRLDWSDIITGRSLGKKYKFRGVAVSQRLDRSRLCGEWDIVPDQQKIVYILAPSNDFSFCNDENVKSSHWEPIISTLADHVPDDSNKNGLSKLTRVSFVCRIFHANEHALYVADQSVSPRLHSVLLRPSVFVPSVLLAGVQKPKPTKVLVLLQDVQVSKVRIVADKYSRLLTLNDNGYAYTEDSYREIWPASHEVRSVLNGIKVFLPKFSPRSRTHDLVKLTGVVCDLDETSALMWPACGSCGSPVDTEDEKLHYCSQCAKVSKDLIVHMSLIIFVKTVDFPKTTSIRVKILHKTVETLLRTIPREGQDIMVREALGKPIGPIRCEVTAAYGGNYALNELPSALWM